MSFVYKNEIILGINIGPAAQDVPDLFRHPWPNNLVEV